MTLADLSADPSLLVHEVVRDDDVVGALTVQRDGRPTAPADQRLLTDLGAQARLVLDHLALVQASARRRATSDLDHLSPRSGRCWP